MILVSGGAGFIGSNFVLDWLAQSDEPVINLDKLTYAGNLENLANLQGDARHVFVQGDLGDRALVERLLAEHKPRAVLHFARSSCAASAISVVRRWRTCLPRWACRRSICRRLKAASAIRVCRPSSAWPRRWE